MLRSVRATELIVLGFAAAAFVAGTVAVAQNAQEPKSGAGAPPPEMPLPAGWTAEDMQACMAAGMPGKNQEWLGKQAGIWHGKTQMWMSPDAEPSSSECTNTVTVMMDGRYIKAEMSGEVPGMGPFSGMGITGYDNVAEKFVGTWIDNHSSGIMNGVGELSKDGKTLTWTFSYHCPLTKKPATMREVDTYPDSNTMIMDMFAKDPKSGKEYKCMHIEFTRKS